MNHKIHILVVCFFSVFFAVNAHANLIVNGSFEDNHVKQNNWSWFSSESVSGWSGSNIEIWDQLLNIKAADGEQFIELNAHPFANAQFSIFQSFNTRLGATYNLSLFYRARSNDSEIFNVLIQDSENNTQLLDQLLDDHGTSYWSNFTTQFTATSTLTKLTLSSIAPFSGTLGNFIDMVSITESTARNPQASVPEPASIGILLLAIFGLIFKRKSLNRPC